jgi:hypothetical protein
MFAGLLFVSMARAEPGAAALLPFGIDLYMQEKTGRGLIYTLTQVVGVAAMVTGTIQSDKLAVQENDAGGTPWRALTAGGVTLAGGSYVVSMVDASNLRQKVSVAWLRRWDADRALLDERYALNAPPAASLLAACPIVAGPRE